MKGLKLKGFLKQRAIRASNNLSLIRKAVISETVCTSMRAANISWFGEMPWVPWNECTASIPLLAQSAAPQCWDSTATTVLRHQPGCGTGKGHLSHTTGLLRVPGAIQDAKELPVPFSSLCGWWNTSYGRFQHIINHQHMERMATAETQNCHSLPGNFPSRDDITRN